MLQKTFVILSFLCCIGYINAAPHLTDKKAIKEAKILYRNLFTTATKGIMFGHQDDTVYGVGWSYEPGQSDVKSVCGDYPAVFGWELGGLELEWKKNLDDVPFDVMREHIVAAYERGGINTISWHPHNPESGLTAWDGKTKTAVKSILPMGENHEKYCSWLNNIASFIGSIRNKDGQPIPILFRPFHEHTATGFWWASAQCSVDEYVALWHFTVNYLKNVKQIHNIIYVYSPDIFISRDHYLERYPGDKWVDILGMDAYHRQQDWDYLSGGNRMLSTLTEIGAEKHKPIAFTETGLEGIPDPQWWTKWLLPVIKNYPLSYVLLWRNSYQRENHFFAPHPGSPSAKDFIEFKNNKEVHILFENDLPNMYK